MKIYQINLDHRLGRQFEPLPEGAQGQTKYLLLAHPGDVNLSVSWDLPDWLGDPRCAGILYIKGVPFSGLPREVARKIEADSEQRVHFLSYAVGSGDDLSGGLSGRFTRFFDGVENRDEINWKMIDEPWPENLLAAYLLAKTLTVVDSETAKSLQAEADSWDALWQTAREEYLLRLDRDLQYESLNIDNAAEVLADLKSCLDSLS